MVVDLAVAAAANAQHGVITRAQLVAAGLTAGAIRARIRTGRLIRLFHGVYAVADPALLSRARETGALLAVGTRGCLSHRTAAAMWQLAASDPETVHVSVVGRKPRPRPGVYIHRVSRLDRADLSTHSRLRVTAPARTLIDFASQSSKAELAHAFGEARANGLLTDDRLDQALERCPHNHVGAVIVRRMLQSDPGSTYTRSRAERLLRKLLAEAQLPQPIVNAPLNGFTVDFLWPKAKLILEVDGYGTHGGRLAFERDRRRDQIHVASGHTVIRVTWEQLRDEALAVIARLAQALARRAA
jgi:very-short-patch-repair endonuclease